MRSSVSRHGFAALRKHPTNQHQCMFHFSSSLPNGVVVVASTQRWVDRVVVGEKLCPFAPPLVAANTLRIVASDATNEQQATFCIRLEAVRLMNDEPSTVENENSPKPESTLVVFDAPFVQQFRDFVHLSWILQEEAIVHGGLQHDLQLVLFHPLATHQTYSDVSDDTECSAAGDYTIRSPYPTIHLLREVDVMQAVTGSYPNLSELPTRNKLKLVEQGYAHCKARLDGCYVNVMPSDN